MNSTKDSHLIIKDHKFIIFGSYTPNVLGQIRGLGEKGISPIGVLIGSKSFRIDKSKYLAKVYPVNSPEEGLSLIIKEFSHEKRKPFLYTDRDDVMELIDSKLNELSDSFFVWNAGKPGRLNAYLNKNEQIKLAKQCGFKVPKTELVTVGQLPISLNYPIFTKAINSLKQWWKGYAFICQNEKDLISVYNIVDSKELLLQEYIIKKDETPIEGISINQGEDIMLYGFTSNYRMPSDSFGTYRHIENFKEKDIEEKIKQFIRTIHYSGPFEIEFIIDQNDKAYFLETNFRIAQQNYGYTTFGVNAPFIYAKSVLKGEIATEEICYTTKRPFNILYEFDDFKSFVLTRKISFFKWIRDVYHTDCFLLYNKKDMAPFYYTLIEKIKSFVKQLYKS